MKIIRDSNPRIGEIETEISKLTTELEQLIAATPKELDHSRTSVFEDMRDCGEDGIPKIEVLKDVLDWRVECMEMARDLLSQGRTVEAAEELKSIDETIEGLNYGG
jgi:hypothetical protein